MGVIRRGKLTRNIGYTPVPIIKMSQSGLLQKKLEEKNKHTVSSGGFITKKERRESRHLESAIQSLKLSPLFSSLTGRDYHSLYINRDKIPKDLAEKFNDFCSKRKELEKKLEEERLEKKKQRYTTKSRILRRANLVAKTAGYSMTILDFCNHLESNLPASEVWFRRLYESTKDRDDKYNRPFLNEKIIPDVQNNSLKYIIEIDGSSHDVEHIKNKDKWKDMVYEKNGYKIFRIKAYNYSSFSDTMTQLKEYKERDLFRRKKLTYVRP